MTIEKTEITEEAIRIVDIQLDAYNNRDIEAFCATFSEKITLCEFPNKVTSTGRAELKERYEKFFETTPDLHCEIVNRIATKNKVIDQEFVLMNGKHMTAVAIYEVERGEIVKVTFMK